VRQPSETPRWLSSDELESWLALVAVTDRLGPALDAHLQHAAGINHYEYAILAVLSEAEDRTVRMSELAGLVNGSLSRLSHATGRLETRGWVCRRPCADDGRITLARLTDEGYAALAEVAPEHVAEARRLVIDALSATQLRQLGSAARQILRTIDPVALDWLETRSGLPQS
jgi:DNA-binding MarR family transcriptional regulator